MLLHIAFHDPLDAWLGRKPHYHVAVKLQKELRWEKTLAPDLDKEAELREVQLSA